MAKPKKKSDRLSEIVILLIVLIGAALIIANTVDQVVDEIDTASQQDTNAVIQPNVESTPTASPTVPPPSGPTFTPTPFKIFG